MKKIKTLIIALNEVKEVIDNLEKANLIDAVAEYITFRENSIHHRDLFFAQPTKTYENDYIVPFDFYQNFYDKYFTGFYKNIARRDSNRGTTSTFFHITCLFKKYLDYSYNVLLKKEVELIIHQNFPHEIFDYIFVSLAKELGIKVIYGSNISYLKKNVIMLRDEVHKLGKFKGESQHIFTNDFNFDDFLRIRNFLFSPAKKEVFSFSSNIVKRALKRRNLYKSVNKNKIIEMQNILKNIEVNKIPENIRYAYFPLHYQPEASTIALGESHIEDQSILIEYMVNQLPKDMYIVVKEHYLQTFNFRDPLFYQKLAELKKVILVSSEMDSTEVLKNAEFAMSITGTVGFEALLMGKPIVYAGNPLYQELPGAFKFDENFNINEVLNFKFDKDKLIKTFTKYLQTGYEGCVDPAVFDLDNTEEVNIERITYAYTDYLTNFSKNNQNYREELKAMYQSLKKKSKKNNNIDENLQKQLTEYLPSVEYFTGRNFIVERHPIKKKIKSYLNKFKSKNCLLK